MSFIFDTGYLFGVSAAGQTPVKFGSLQEIETELSGDMVRNGTNMQFQSVLTMRSRALKFRAGVANINGLMMTQLFFGQAPSAGSQGVSRDQSITVSSTRPYTATPTVPNSGTWVQDLGVQYSTSGIVLTPTDGSISAGQYSVTDGIYTFCAADAGKSLTANYLYSQASGVSLALTNPWQGIVPTWQAVLNWQYNGQQITWNLPRCCSPDFKMLTPLEKISIPNFSFEAQGDASSVQGSLGIFSYAN